MFILRRYKRLLPSRIARTFKNFGKFSGGGYQLVWQKIVLAKSRRKHAFSLGVVTTLLCDQVTNDVANFGILLYERRSHRCPEQKRDPSTTEYIQEYQNKQS